MSYPGLIGGIAPESTVDYYRRILADYAQRRPGSPAPCLLINRISSATLLRLAEHDRPQLAAYLLESLRVLERGGATFAAFLSNTPHLVFDVLERESPLPLVGIVGAVVAEAEARGFTRLGLLGTGFTMRAGFYPEACRRRGIDVIVPPAAELDEIHARYVGELAKGVFRPETRAVVMDAIARMVRDDRVDAVVLGGTELPILLDAIAAPPVPLLNTLTIHAGAIVDRMLAAG
jgi:aspartate racemase